jgi:hypothetical protein
MECEAMNINLNLTFKDINSFRLENKKIKFNFIGSTTQSIEINNFILYLDLINKFTKEKKLSIASCTKIAQANFSCEILVDNEINYSSIELSPYNYYINNISQYGSISHEITVLPHIFKSNIIKISKCPKLKDFTINGNFDGIINDTINFEMEGTFQLKFSSNCSLYKNPKGKAEIHCAINNNFLSKFEMQVLKDQFTILNIDLTNKIKCINESEPSKEDNEEENEEENEKK